MDKIIIPIIENELNNLAEEIKYSEKAIERDNRFLDEADEKKAAAEKRIKGEWKKIKVYLMKMAKLKAVIKEVESNGV